MKLVSNDQNAIANAENNVSCGHDEEEWQVRCSVEYISKYYSSNTRTYIHIMEHIYSFLCQCR